MPKETESWITVKKELWKLSMDDLNKRLKELELELWEWQRKSMAGNKRMMPLRSKHPNLSVLRHRITSIKTIIKEKENGKRRSKNTIS